MSYLKFPIVLNTAKDSHPSISRTKVICLLLKHMFSKHVEIFSRQSEGSNSSALSTILEYDLMNYTHDTFYKNTVFII